VEILKILEVTLDQDLVIDALETVSPVCHCLDIWRDLPIVRLEVQFGGRAFSRVEIDLGKYPESFVLGKVASDCEAAWIGQQSDLFLRVEMLNDQ
jgi:hypothetical protein